MTERAVTSAWTALAGTESANWPTVPHFEILAELGRGGMGVVYRAQHQILQQPVALKLLRDGALASPQEQARFRIEAEAAARMRHPNIVSILEIGQHQGRPYFAMELVEGGSLDRHLAGQPQPAARAADMVRVLALAVQHAHEQKVIHRDLKPANILLSKIDDFGLMIDGSKTKNPPSSIINHQSSIINLKITDFGLAKRLDSESTALTREGAVLGTAGYMAPEQAAGRVGDIGPATDVYALGAILYEMLTGQPPFQAESWNQILQQVLYDEPASPTRLRPDIPADLETICLKCLEKEPGRRYTRAADLADDLERFCSGKSVAAVSPDARERLQRWAARDGFQLAGVLGRGPRSTVYHAYYGPLRQPMAVKVFAAGSCPRDAWEERLRRDVQLRAALAHPHIVSVHRAGWWDGAPYVAGEFVPQGCLAAKIDGKPYPILQALRLGEQLAQILRYLHRQGVVHGNLKPSNVLLAADEIPRVVDFHPTGGLLLGTLTGDGIEPAPLGYLAPETLRDPSREPRPYTDVYGLGTIFYAMLTGRPPFAGSTAREVFDQVREKEPVPPSQLNAKVTRPVEAFCLRCLRKNPWRRYTRAYDVMMRLRSLLADPQCGAESDAQRPRSRPAGQGD